MPIKVLNAKKTRMTGMDIFGNTGKGRRVSLRARAMIAAAMLIVPLGGANADDSVPAKQAAVRSPAAPLLTPWLSLAGARLSSAIDATGTPSMRPALVGFQRFIHPAAVAGRGSDTYVADIGAGAVFRFDSSLDAMVALPGIRAQKGIQLHVGGDLSLYVLDQAGRRVLQYARSGQLLGTFSDPLNLGRPVDVALDETRGRLLVADGMYNHLVAFHPMGGGAQVILLRSGAGERVFSIAAMAIGAEGIFLSDPLCACIALVSLDGAVLRTFGHHEVNQPGPIAVDRDNRVFVIDVFDGSLKVFWHGELIHDLSAGELGLRQINDVWVNDGSIILAGGTGTGVKIMRLAPASAR